MHRVIEVMVVDLDEIRDGIGKTKLVVDDTNSKVELMLDWSASSSGGSTSSGERDEKERREMRSLIQLLLDSVVQTREQPADTSGPARSSPTPSSRSAPTARAVEELLARSPLTTQVRAMLSEALDAELHVARTRRGGARPPAAQARGRWA